MAMYWKKKGRIFRAKGQFGWMNNHAQIPTALVLPDRIRIYFATRPRNNISLTSFLDVDRADPSRILYLHKKPILEPGVPGMFDEHGIMPQYVCMVEDEVWLYYSGWSRRTTIPYSNWTGLAASMDGGMTFTKCFKTPILDRCEADLLSATGCYLQREGDSWLMIYASGTDWIRVDDRYEEMYLLRRAFSEDGIHWERDPGNFITPHNDLEPMHRPTFFQMSDTWHLWFCYRGIEDFRDGANSYRIGYAYSHDFETWTRTDNQAGIQVSPTGWDSTMQAYPYIVKCGRNRYMFYNGNGFGQGGFGYAELCGDF